SRSRGLRAAVRSPRAVRGPADRPAAARRAGDRRARRAAVGRLSRRADGGHRRAPVRRHLRGGALPAARHAPAAVRRPAGHRARDHRPRRVLLPGRGRAAAAGPGLLRRLRRRRAARAAARPAHARRAGAAAAARLRPGRPRLNGRRGRAARSAYFVTTIVPVIPGWIVHTYWTVPALASLVE